MSGRMTYYKLYSDRLEKMVKRPEPEEMPVYMDMRGADEFAKQSGRRISDLSHAEMEQFVHPRRNA